MCSVFPLLQPSQKGHASYCHLMFSFISQFVLGSSSWIDICSTSSLLVWYFFHTACLSSSNRYILLVHAFAVACVIFCHSPCSPMCSSLHPGSLWVNALCLVSLCVLATWVFQFLPCYCIFFLLLALLTFPWRYNSTVERRGAHVLHLYAYSLILYLICWLDSSFLWALLLYPHTGLQRL